MAEGGVQVMFRRLLALFMAAIMLLLLFPLAGCLEAENKKSLLQGGNGAAEELDDETITGVEDETTDCTDGLKDDDEADRLDEVTELENGGRDDSVENEKQEQDIPEEEIIIHQEEDEVIFRVEFSRDPMSIYLYTVSKNGILEASLGRGQGINYKYKLDLSDGLGHVFENGNVQLTRPQLDYLIEMAEDVMRIEELDRIAHQGTGTGWTLGFWHNTYVDCNYYFDYGSSTLAYNFINTLILLAPISKPVDPHLPKDNNIWDRVVRSHEENGYEIGKRPWEIGIELPESYHSLNRRKNYSS